MTTYKNILTGYINDRKDDPSKKYLIITNVSDKPVTLEPKGRVFLNMTPSQIKVMNPKIPDFSKSEKLEDKNNEDGFNQAEEAQAKQPF